MMYQSINQFLFPSIKRHKQQHIKKHKQQKVEQKMAEVQLKAKNRLMSVAPP